MTFPTPSVVDNFNRSDEGPPPSASWITPTGLGGLKVVSNECVADGASNNTAVYDTSYGPNMDAFVTIATLPSGTNRVWVMARLQQYTAGSTIDGYIVEYQHSATALRIRGLTNGTPATIVEGVITLSAGNSIGIRCWGSTIEAWIDTGTGWRIAAAVTDSTYGSAGAAGLLMTGTVSTFDNFGAGNASNQLHGHMTPNRGFW